MVPGPLRAREQRWRRLRHRPLPALLGPPRRGLLLCPKQPSAGDAGLEYALASRQAPVRDAWERPEDVWLALEDSPAVVIDALFGVNLDGSRRLEGPFLNWIQAMNTAGTVRLAVDVPSGMDAETGAAHPECVQAHVTAVMGAPKLGFAANPEAVGHVIEVDIGLPDAIHAPHRL